MIGHGYPRKSTTLLLMACLVVVFANDLLAQDPPAVNVPLVNKNGGVGLTAAPGFGVEVSVSVIAGDTSDATATRLTFRNPRAERRIVAMEGAPEGPFEGARVLAFDYLLTAKSNSLRDIWGPSPSIVALLFERDGGVWYRMIGKFDRDPFGLNELRLPLRGAFTRARFATDSDDEIRWDQVERVWLGVVDDGPMTGTFEVRRARFTDEPFRPEAPFRFGEKWEVSQDPAVRSRLTESEHDEPPGASFEFEIPGGRHMYAMIRTPVEVDELEAYSGLQFYTVLTELPEGIDGLLVMLIEKDGSQYQAVPPPRASRDLQEVTIPFERFERGNWSKDENDRLDLEEVNYLAIGMHGTTPATASGTIIISTPQFVP